MSDLTKKDLARFSRRYMIASQACFNYETMQSPGAIFAIGPLLEKIYDDNPDVLKDKFKAHLQFYNTQTTFGSAILAATLAIEETRDPNCTETAIAIRTSLMGPFAGIGDALFGTLPRVILAAMSGYAAIEGDFVTGLLTCLLGGGLIFYLRWLLIKTGFYQGAKFISEKQSQLNNIRQTVSILGIMIVGALIASNIGVVTPIEITVGESIKPLQEVFDGILPNLIPVIIVAAVYFGLDLKKMNTVRMVWVIVFISLILSYLGILA
ncbi:PTS system mannose/fructose/sorbose family transporter subunit IID [Breznakia pachnodae]|uniref:PTS system mannose-specific IID component n=1 Tax=Breznakia pachnodae TaxID=265178 RepID=A0ABU0E1C7_9FIRM|nr:PTS system mannose/fructose/sorbose family transporter subunit IID [Breznakia pachnodae]MDQ0360533.1 PTS system mannose-specific IID component [Breznakia pachnodae]